WFRLPVFRILRAILRDFGFIAVADRQQHFLREIQIAPLFAVILVDVRLDDGVDRAAFLTEAAENALGQIDVVAGGAARAVCTRLRLDRDGHRRADCLAQFASDAPLFPVGIA